MKTGEKASWNHGNKGKYWFGNKKLMTIFCDRSTYDLFYGLKNQSGTSQYRCAWDYGR
jgi:hypothetical protein